MVYSRIIASITACDIIDQLFVLIVRSMGFGRVLFQ